MDYLVAATVIPAFLLVVAHSISWVVTKLGSDRSKAQIGTYCLLFGINLGALGRSDWQSVTDEILGYCLGFIILWWLWFSTGRSSVNPETT